MNRLFNMDNLFFTFMGRIADLIILNILCLICSIPIVTIGASVTAMYHVTLKMARNEESYIFRSFFHSFKQNFKQATIIWVLMLLAGLFLGMDFWILRIMDFSSFTQVMTVALYFIALLYAMTLAYIFPLLAKFENSIRNTFKNALLLAIRHLPFTILILIVNIVPALLTLTIPVLLNYGLLVWIMAGFSLIAFIDSLLFVRIFVHYLPVDNTAATDKDTCE